MPLIKKDGLLKKVIFMGGKEVGYSCFLFLIQNQKKFNVQIEALFTNTLNPSLHPYFESIAHLRVSAHFLVTRLGEIVQFVSSGDRAWHAGESHWCGQTNCNDFSIGIELEGTDDQAYTDVQYVQLRQLIKALQRYHPSLDQSDIVGHSDIAPGRKTDPGGCFDWHRLADVSNDNVKL